MLCHAQLLLLLRAVKATQPLSMPSSTWTPLRKRKLNFRLIREHFVKLAQQCESSPALLTRLFVFLMLFWYVCVCARTWALEYGACCWQDVEKLEAVVEEDLLAPLAEAAAAGPDIATMAFWNTVMSDFDSNKFVISTPRL